MINAIIVDDEVYGRRNLDKMLKTYCPRINVTGHAASVKEASELIQDLEPDIVFLDIYMPGEDGFDLLDKKSKWKKQPVIVFVTAYEQFAIKAIKANAVDYLMKPLDIDELVACEQKLLEKTKSRVIIQDEQDTEEGGMKLRDNKILISDSKWIHLINIDDIIFIEADNNYSIVHYYDKQQEHKSFVSKTLKDFEDVLNDVGFFRVHKSNIINVSKVKSYQKEGTGHVIMDNDKSIEVSRRKSTLFKKYIFDNFNSLY